MSKTKGRAKQFEDWEEKPAKDYDPEDAPATDNEDSGSEASVDENAGTEHYAPVGKSKLRRKQDVKLGPAYRGTRVTRDALEQSSESEDYEDALEDLLNGNEDDDSEEDEEDGEDFVDPDEADLERDQKEQGGEDAEIDSDEAFGETDEENFSKLGYTFRGSSQPMPVKGKRVARPTAADFLDDEAELSEDGEGLEGEDDDDDEEDEDDEEEDSDDDMDGFIDDGESEDDEDQEDEDQEDDEDSDESAEEAPKKSSKLEKDFAKLAMKADGKSGVTGSLVDSQKKDVAKGLAVRQQRKAFDAALNIRIRLQKAIVASNTIPTVDSSDDQNEPYEAAEAAAIKLWNAIDAFRTDMQPGAGQKRKRTIDVDDSSQDIWEKMQDIETKGHIRRKNVLQNWDDKVKKARMDPAAQQGFRNKQAKGQLSLTAWLEQKMQDPEGTERLVKRTRTPRSCAPAQVAKKVAEDPDIYDDADFYQLLLKELVDQRTADASATTTGPTATLRYAAVKEAKTKKNVDTKASKGRKMRFNVHEKLQEFMAPEDRRQWEPSAIDRLFGTLFGQQVENVLDEDAVSEDEEMGGVTAEEAGLRLFRS